MQSLGWFLTGPFLYAAVAVCLGGSAYRIAGWLRLPRHLRWEIYPIPHLGAEGSKYQQVDFGKLPGRRHRGAEIAFVLQEILFLKKVFLRQRKLWPGSFLLHLGLYLGVVFCGLLAAEALLALLGGGLPGEPELRLVGVFHRATVVIGGGGLTAALAGAILLLDRRLRDQGLRDMSDTVTFFNLGLLLAVFGSALLAWLTADPSFAQLKAHVLSLLRGEPAVVASPAITLALFFGGLFLIYLPFSRMFHFAAKYFTYHEVLWDDESMRQGSRMESDFAGYLQRPVAWSAQHVRFQAAWLDQVSLEDDEGEPHGK